MVTDDEDRSESDDDDPMEESDDDSVIIQKVTPPLRITRMDSDEVEIIPPQTPTPTYAQATDPITPTLQSNTSTRSVSDPQSNTQENRTRNISTPSKRNMTPSVNRSYVTRNATNQSLPREVRALKDWNATTTNTTETTRETENSSKPTIFDNTDPSDLVAALTVNESLMSDPGEPTNFKQAFFGPEKHKWTPSMLEEIHNFTKRKAWHKYDRNKVKKEGRKIIGTKWVYKIKDEHDGTKRYKSRAVIQGFMEIPGVDYTTSFSPVATDSTIRVTFGVALYYGWTIEMIDYESAFLNAELDRPLYVEWPPGIVELGEITQEEKEKYCIMLDRAMYGTSAAPIRWMETLSTHLINIGLTQSLTDPCLFYKKNSQGDLVLIATLFVDDTIAAGTEEELKWFYENVRKKFVIQELGQLTKHLGIRYDWKKDNEGQTYLEASMDKLIEEIIRYYETLRDKKVKNSNLPGAPGKVLFKSEENSDPLDVENYRSIVGKLLYLSTKLRPDIANAVRELSSHLSHPNQSHWDAVEKVVGYLKTNGSKRVELHRPKSLRVLAFVDADYAKDETRKSISGRVGTLGGMLVSWQSARQSCVTLSSTESEYVSLSNCCQEVVFIQSLIKELTGKERKAIIFEDNVGAIFLVKNKQVGVRTKHIDIRMHWIRTLCEKLLDVRFVKSEDNIADLCTKNLPVKDFEKHTNSILKGELIKEEVIQEIIGEDVKEDQSDDTTQHSPDGSPPLEEVDNNILSNPFVEDPILDSPEWTIVKHKRRTRKVNR